MKQKYTNEQREACVYAYRSGTSVQEIVQQFSIPRSTIYAWIKQPEKTPKAPTLRNFRLMEKTIVRLKAIIEILQSIDCSVKAPLQERLKIFEQLYGKYNVHQLSDALLVPRGTFYNYIYRNKRDNIWYKKRRETLRLQIQEIYDESNQIYGVEKIAAVLKTRGTIVSARIVRELMQEMGLISIRLSAKELYDKDKPLYRNYLNQQFTVTRPNEVWVSDITYFRFNNKNYYICVIIDLYARKVVAYRVGLRNSTQLTKATFKLAYESRKPVEDLLFHTDRGTNYRSNTFCKYLQSLQVKQSFSRAHVPYDNSVMESFFASMKREELYRRKYRSEKDFRTAIDKYILFYNEQRPHAKNRYKTPLQKEEDFFNE